jgi:hypothetical protein
VHLPGGTSPQPGSHHHRKPVRRRRDLIVVGVSVAIAVLLASVGSLAIADRDPEIKLTSVSAAADTYVVQQYPKAVYGSATKLTAAQWRNWNTEAYLLFVVPLDAKSIVSARVELSFERLSHRPSEVQLHRLPTTGWSEEYTAFRNKPAVGDQLAVTKLSDPEAETVSFDVTQYVREPGFYAFAMTNPDAKSVASVHSREQGADGPRLVVGTLPGGEPGPLPTGNQPKPPSPSPTVGPKPSPTGTPSPPPPPPPPVGSKGTLCGASFNTESSGENYQEALTRVDGYYNGLEMLRVFYPGKPAAWPGKVNASKRPMTVSFKFPPTEVANGTHDAYMRNWFATAPRDQDIYWTYWHEPEDDISAGQITAASYRAAWKRLRTLADQARNDRLTATLILMGWSLAPASRRSVNDYFPGKDVVQALGWDVYNPGEEKGIYQDPAVMYKRVVEYSQAQDLPFGIAETGSYLIKGDSGAGRAAWLRSVASYLSSEGALWVAYFDLNWPSGDFRLRDSASMKAWREFCS